MKRRKASGAHYRNQKKQRDEFLKSYPKITAFQAGGAADQERPAFPSAAAARVATEQVFWRQEIDDQEVHPEEEAEADEEPDFILCESDEEIGNNCQLLFCKSGYQSNKPARGWQIDHCKANNVDINPTFLERYLYSVAWRIIGKYN